MSSFAGVQLRRTRGPAAPATPRYARARRSAAAVQRGSPSSSASQPGEAQSSSAEAPAAAEAGPLRALREGRWFKLICGASTQEVPLVRNLALVYTLAGADCIDVAADPAVIRAARDGADAALALAGWGRERRPWTMVSVNDGEDVHFRKAHFDPAACPADCPRPCERVCPADAIGAAGVLPARCYGCGRCLPVCPLGLVVARPTSHAPSALPALLAGLEVDAVEIHTRAAAGAAGVGRLWREGPGRLRGLRLLAVSFQDDPALGPFLDALPPALQPRPGAPLPLPLLLQADGLPMSGDVGAGKARFAVSLAPKVLERVRGWRPEWRRDLFVQLAGGTNDTTAARARRAGLLAGPAAVASQAGIAGAAFGGYARALMRPHFEGAPARLEEQPAALEAAVAAAAALVDQWKAPHA